jgi:hypothetical protein
MYTSFDIDDLESLLGEKLTAYRMGCANEIVDDDTASISRGDVAHHDDDAQMGAYDLSSSPGSDAAEYGYSADADCSADDYCETMHALCSESIYSDRPTTHVKMPFVAAVLCARLHGFAAALPARDQSGSHANAGFGDADSASFRSVASISLDEATSLDERAAEALLLDLTPDDVLDFQRRMIADAARPEPWRACAAR